MTIADMPISAAAARNSAGHQMTEQTLALYDGTELFFRAWMPEGAATKALFLFHRGHEHSGRFVDLVEELASDADTALFAWDARGHGLSPGPRGYAPSFSHTIRDMDFFIRALQQRHGIADGRTVVVAHSVAAVAAAAWVHGYAPRIAGLVLVALAFRVKLYVPLAIGGLRFIQKVKRGKPAFIKSYVRAKMLTHDAAHAAAYDADPLIAKSIAVNILLDLHDTSTRVVEDAGAIHAPTLVLGAGKDWVVKHGPQQLFFNRLSSPHKRFRAFPGMFHDLLHEKERHLVLGEINDFMAEVFARDEVLPVLLDADERGMTHDEAARLGRRLSAFSPRGLSFAVQRMFLHSPIAGLSHAVKIGQKTGFNSGLSLDAVYENRPRGGLLIGKMIDKAYLSAIGWRGIRQRKVHLEELLRVAIAGLRAAGQSIRIVDVAAGTGRYVIDAMAADGGSDLSAVLRDFEPKNLEAARVYAQSKGITKIDFAAADAFDQPSLAALTPAPNIAITSGIFELFGDNRKVLSTLRGLGATMRERGGVLIYTGQPWHPQLEMIARVLTGLDGKPWVMRRRTQMELDDLVRAAGFEKCETRIDSYGIFTVSLARLPAALGL